MTSASDGSPSRDGILVSAVILGLLAAAYATFALSTGREGHAIAPGLTTVTMFLVSLSRMRGPRAR
jgi:hypothetical protein